MSVAQWNALDWLLASVVVISAAAGFRRGIVRTVLGLAGYISGFMLASWKYVQVGNRITGHGWIKSPATARVVAYLAIVVVVVIAFELIARLIHRTVQAVGLSFMNRLLGAGFGLIRGAMAGIALLMIPARLAPGSTLVATSVLSPCFFAVVHDVSFLLPQYMQHRALGSDFIPKNKNGSG